MANQSKVDPNVSPDVSSQGVQTDSDDLFSEAMILSDDSKVHYCTGFPGCEMLRWLSNLFGILFWWGKKRNLL